MKKVILIFIIFFITINLSYSQNNHEYKINRSIKIHFISLKLSHSNIYKKNKERTIIGITISRDNDSISRIQKIYDKEDSTKPKGLTYLEELNWGSIKISTKTFDKIISLIEKLDIENLNKQFPDLYMCGSRHYYLTFSGEGYQISSTVISPDIDTKERGLEDFLTVSNEIWKLTEL
jgi:hypothetical protein